MARRQSDKRAAAGHRGSMMIIVLMMVLVCIFIGFWTWRINVQTHAYAATAEALEGEIADAYDEQAAIQDQLDYINSDEYIEDIAREKLGLLYDNEIIFKKQGR